MLGKPVQFVGTDRFEVISRLGRGGMGAVYQVYDRQLQQRVALKTCGEVDGDRLLRFKREFRSLKSLSHPHIVELGELFQVDGTWFFTMELIPGENFLSYVRRDDEVLPRPRSAEPVTTTIGGQSASRRPLSFVAPGAVEMRFDDVRLRRTLAQLAAALETLHAHGHIHRDVKPSNVLVTPEGRTVLIDFGLVTGADPGGQSTEFEFMGTIPYMAPEQSERGGLSPAADWYALGCLLFQALCGRLPFEGEGVNILVQKQLQPAPKVKELSPDAPDDLALLCDGLLRTDPGQRPTGSAVLQALFAGDEQGRHSVPISHERLGAPFLGREHELRQLRNALNESAEHARPVVLFGAAGSGKSSLVRRFVELTLCESADVLILRGQGCEHERVPFNALDLALDELSRWLKHEDSSALDVLLPTELLLLSETFPVLQRIPRIRQTVQFQPEAVDPRERRVRVMIALRRLLRRLAQQRRIILIVEDLHWCDEDSYRLLDELTRAPEQPPLFVLLTDRRPPPSDEERSTPRRESAELRLRRRARAIAVPGLSTEECIRLTHRLSGQASREAGRENEALARSLAEQTGGNPYFFSMLLQHYLEHPATGSPPMTLDRLLLDLLGDLPERTQEVARLVCLATGPVSLKVIAEAAEIDLEETRQHVKALELSRFVRASESRAGGTVETFHDRVRSAITDGLSEAEKSWLHQSLARAMEVHRSAAAMTAKHLIASGQTERGAHFLKRAAEEAAQNSAFDEAAEHYRLASELGAWTLRQKAELAEVRGNALARGGRGGEAALAYLQAADGQLGQKAATLRFRAGYEYLTNGSYRLGLEIILPVLADLGVGYPRSQRAAFFQGVRDRLRFLLRGYEFSERGSEELSADALLQVDLEYALGRALLDHDPIVALALIQRSSLRALDLGEPGRATRALTHEATALAWQKPSERAKSDALFAQARALGERSGDRRLVESVDWGRGLAAYAGSLCFGEALQTLSDLPQGRSDPRRLGDREERRERLVAWFQCAFQVGRWLELSRRAVEVTDESCARGDRYLGDRVRGAWLSFTHLMAGDAEAARRELETARGDATSSRSPLEQLSFLEAELRIDLATDNLDAAQQHWATFLPVAGSALLRRAAPLTDYVLTHWELLLVLKFLHRTGEDLWRRRAKALIRRAQQRPQTPFQASAAVGRAVLAVDQDQPELAAQLFSSAARLYQAAQMLPHMHACDARRAWLIAPASAHVAQGRALKWFTAQGVAVPEQMVDMLVPKLPEVR